MEEAYKEQVALLLKVLPEVGKEKCFLLHGGTAINLFIRDMPRLSVDIDLTYAWIEDRATSLEKIAGALERIKANVEAVVPNVHVTHQVQAAKLLIAARGAQIKLEVNLTNRGLWGEPQSLLLCKKAQNEFDAFCATSTVSFGQLYGGKICAALDRQHPRDLFDVKYLLQNEGFSEEVRIGFILCLLGSDRPIHELLQPHFQDQWLAMDNQFTGMTVEEFSYAEYEAVRDELVKTVQISLTQQDKKFLLGFNNLEPDWSIYDFNAYPSVQWKLQNLEKLKAANPDKHAEQQQALRDKLGE